MLYYFIVYACHFNVVSSYEKIIKNRLKSFFVQKKDHHSIIDVALPDIPDHTYNYHEYQGGFVSDVFK